MLWRLLVAVFSFFLTAACSSGHTFSDQLVLSPAPPTMENPCLTTQEVPIGKKAFKGIELYSWQQGVGDWVFSLLLGTNRLKTIQDVQSYSMDLPAVRKCICSLHAGVNVFWMDAAQETHGGSDQPLLMPPETIITEITAYADQCGVVLHLP